MRNLKVAYILHRFPVLSETFVLDEILEVGRKGIDVSIFSFEMPYDKIIHKDAEGIKGVFYALDPKIGAMPFITVIKSNLRFLFRFPLGYIYSLFRYAFKIGKKEFLQIFYLCNAIQREGIEHLHAHFACLGATAGMLISRFLDIPFSFTVHAHDIFVENDFLEEKLERAKYVIAISGYNKKYLLEKFPDISPEKIKVIHCGVDVERFTPLRDKSITGFRHQEKKPEENIHVLSGGRLVEKKGFIYLIKACRILADRGIKFRCNIFGDGPLKEKLTDEVKKSGLGNTVHFTGAVKRDRVLQLLAGSDIFVVPSIIDTMGDREGIPVTLIEAMACGKPAVAANISGIPELINSGEDGLLVPQADEQSLAQAMIKLIEDTELRKHLGIRAREKVVERFNLTKTSAEVVQLFRCIS